METKALVCNIQPMNGDQRRVSGVRKDTDIKSAV
jgi:hypothetical protein